MTFAAYGARLKFMVLTLRKLNATVQQKCLKYHRYTIGTTTTTKSFYGLLLDIGTTDGTFSESIGFTSGLHLGIAHGKHLKKGRLFK